MECTAAAQNEAAAGKSELHYFQLKAVLDYVLSCVLSIEWMLNSVCPQGHFTAWCERKRHSCAAAITVISCYMKPQFFLVQTGGFQLHMVDMVSEVEMTFAFKVIAA